MHLNFLYVFYRKKKKKDLKVCFSFRAVTDSIIGQVWLCWEETAEPGSCITV